MSARDPLEAEVLAQLTPSPAEEKAVQEAVAELERRCDARLAELGLSGRARVQGSIAKGTWLRGSADLDLFLLLDPSVPAERLESVAASVGQVVLRDARRRYAQHPYLTGAFVHDGQAWAVDLVPAYAVANAGARMSAVDRTPFHTAWVNTHLDAHAKADVRLLKRWLKGTGTYGAQTSAGGFSGYLTELLVASRGGFAAALAWLAADAQPRRLALGADQVTDDVAPLVVVDPVDPARNAAAAVTAATLERAGAAARAYAARPERAFFFPAPPRGEAPAVLHGALAGHAWAGIVARPGNVRLDIVFPQFQRATRTLSAALGRAGFPVVRAEALHLPDETEVLLQFLCTGGELPATRTHTGPRADSGEGAQRFRSKWSAHADALGPVHDAGGVLAVELAVRERTPAQWLAANVTKEGLGRHVTDAMARRSVLSDPALAPAAWAPAVADFVLGRAPWQR